MTDTIEHGFTAVNAEPRVVGGIGMIAFLSTESCAIRQIEDRWVTTSETLNNLQVHDDRAADRYDETDFLMGISLNGFCHSLKTSFTMPY